MDISQHINGVTIHNDWGPDLKTSITVEEDTSRFPGIWISIVHSCHADCMRTDTIYIPYFGETLHSLSNNKI